MDNSPEIVIEEKPANQVIVLVPFQDPNVLLRAGQMQKIAAAYEITSAQLNECACDDLKAIKALQKRVEECRDSEVRPFNEIVKATNNKYRPAAQFLEEAEKILKGKIGGWLEKERQRAAEEQRVAEELARQERLRLEAIARQEREEAEQKQREAIAAQEAIMLAERRRVEAEQAAQRASEEALQAKSDQEAAEALARAEEANRALSEARLAEDNAVFAETAIVAEHGMAIETAAAASMSALAVTSKSATVAKVGGISSKTSWKARITNKEAFLKYVADNPEKCADWVDIKMQPLNSLAKALKNNMDIPGVQAYPDTSIAARAA